MSGWKYAFALSKEEVREKVPPGTVKLVARDSSTSLDAEQPPSDGSTIRFPVPSSDPADPLNWPTWRKIALLLVASIYAFVANFGGSAIAPALSLWYQTFPMEPKPFTELTYFIAVNVLMLGASNIWWVPLSNWIGRRPVLLIATLIMTFSAMWCGLATSYDSLLAARIIQGIGGGAADTVAPALVGDVYFIDERGRAMAVYTVFLAAGSIVGGIAGGYIGFQYGWAYIFWVSVALSAACFVGVALLVPETLYYRDTHPASPSPPSSSPDADTKTEEAAIKHSEVSTQASSPHEPFTFGRSLGFRGIRAQNSLFHQFTQPWRTLSLPGTWVVMLHYAGLVGGVVTISMVGAQIVSAPPYLWGANAGLINIGGLLGVVLGGVYTYALADWRLRRSAAKQGRRGMAEPEDRLPTMFMPLAVATCGFFVFGFCAQYPGPKMWVGLQFGYGMLAFGLMQVPSVGFGYLIDCYAHLAADCFVIVTILRSIIAFAWTFFVAEWVMERGAAEPFGIFGMLMGLFGLLTVPLYLYGKRMRIAQA